MKPRRTSAIAAAGVMALGALFGISSAGPAAAASYTHLCVDRDGESLCAWANGSEQPVGVIYEPSTGSSTTNWVYPTVDGTSGTISQADTSLCMQIDHDGGNVVREAPCSDGGTPETLAEPVRRRAHRVPQRLGRRLLRRPMVPDVGGQSDRL